MTFLQIPQAVSNIYGNGLSSYNSVSVLVYSTIANQPILSVLSSTSTNSQTQAYIQSENTKNSIDFYN